MNIITDQQKPIIFIKELTKNAHTCQTGSLKSKEKKLLQKIVFTILQTLVKNVICVQDYKMSSEGVSDRFVVKCKPV